MKNIAIITAKGGNTSVQNKNIIPILGIPIMLYPLRAAQQARLVDRVYVSTEDKSIAHIAREAGAEILERPAELSTSHSQHKDVIEFAVKQAEKENPELENVTVLLGNTVMVTAGLIDKAFRLLAGDDCDSVATVWKAQDDHPFRAMVRDEEGFMKPFQKRDISSNRQSYPEVFFYDQGIWAFKKECAHRQEGPSPWVWLGKRCKMIERPWVTGRDIHSWIDVAASAWYLNAIQAYDFMDFEDS
ncbi:MAG: NTP transferase domain-containing protein [Opitutales bacterium]|nr:NTP transferase domain-containing protein [Opitutales bacterium]